MGWKEKEYDTQKNPKPPKKQQKPNQNKTKLPRTVSSHGKAWSSCNNHIVRLGIWWSVIIGVLKTYKEETVNYDFPYILLDTSFYSILCKWMDYNTIILLELYRIHKCFKEYYSPSGRWNFCLVPVSTWQLKKKNNKSIFFLEKMQFGTSIVCGEVDSPWL